MAELDSSFLTHQLPREMAPVFEGLLCPCSLPWRRFDDAVGERDRRRGQRGRTPGPVVERREQREEEAEREPAQGVGPDPQGLAVRAPLQRLPIRAGESPSLQADSALHVAGMNTHTASRKGYPL